MKHTASYSRNVTKKTTESERSVYLIRTKKSTDKEATTFFSVQGAKSKKIEYAAITFSLDGGSQYQGGSTLMGEMKFTDFENNKIDYKGNVDRVITGDDGLALRDNVELEFKVIEDIKMATYIQDEANDQNNDMKLVTLIQNCPLPANGQCEHGDRTEFFSTTSLELLSDQKEGCEYFNRVWTSSDITSLQDGS